LLNCLQQEVPAQLGERYCVGYIDGSASRCQTLDSLVEKILHELAITPTEASPHDDPLIKLEMALTPPLKKVYVLCMDEFEGICKKCDERLLNSLRSLATAGNLCIVTASRKPLFEVIKDSLGKTSPFFNIFEQIQLGPFDQEEAEHFATEKGEQAGFTPQDQEYLLKLAQLDEDQLKWQPVLLQYVGHRIQNDQYHKTYKPYDAEYWQQFRNAISKILSEIVS
jgi:hypothetical protein